MISNGKAAVTTQAPEPGTSPADRAIRMAAALAAELAVVRERLQVIEMMIERKGLIMSDEIERFVPTDDEHCRLRTARVGLIDRVFKALRA